MKLTVVAKQAEKAVLRVLERRQGRALTARERREARREVRQAVAYEAVVDLTDRVQRGLRPRKRTKVTRRKAA